eukprot:5251682-Pyramimonas_sp.AAC.1
MKIPCTLPTFIIFSSAGMIPGANMSVPSSSSISSDEMLHLATASPIPSALAKVSTKTPLPPSQAVG